MYHFRSFPAIPLSPVSTFRFPSVVARFAVPIVWRAACPAAICLRPVPRSVASSHVINRSPCLLSHDATSHSRIADVGISPLSVSVERGVERGASVTGSCKFIPCIAFDNRAYENGVSGNPFVSGLCGSGVSIFRTHHIYADAVLCIHQEEEPMTMPDERGYRFRGFSK